MLVPLLLLLSISTNANTFSSDYDYVNNVTINTRTRIEFYGETHFNIGGVNVALDRDYFQILDTEFHFKVSFNDSEHYNIQLVSCFCTLGGFYYFDDDDQITAYEPYTDEYNIGQDTNELNFSFDVSNFSISTVEELQYIGVGIYNMNDVNNGRAVGYQLVNAYTGHQTYAISSNYVFIDYVNILPSDYLLYTRDNNVYSFSSDSINFISANFFNSGNSYYQGYDYGYEIGYTVGDNDGYNRGYSTGYNNGFNDGFDSDTTAVTIFNGILSIGMLPINFFLAIFNFEILGINITNFISALLSMCLVIIVLRLVVGSGSSGS